MAHVRSRFLGRGCDEALFSVKSKGFSVQKRGGNLVNEGCAKDFYRKLRKGNSVKRFGPLSEPLESEN